MTAPSATPGIWRRLLDSANAAVERPSDMTRARDFKHCAVIAHSRGELPGRDDKDLARPFTSLIGFGRAWPAMAVGDRRASADAVLAAVEGCAAQLGDLVPTRPPDEPAEPLWKSRADIGG